MPKPNYQTKCRDPNCQTQNVLVLLPRHFHHQCTINCKKHQASPFQIGQWQGVSDLPLLGSCMHNIGLAIKGKQNVLENFKYIHTYSYMTLYGCYYHFRLDPTDSINNTFA